MKEFLRYLERNELGVFIFKPTGDLCIRPKNWRAKNFFCEFKSPDMAPPCISVNQFYYIGEFD